MSKARTVIGIVGGALLVLSSGAHTFLGWKAMSEQLASTNAPADLVHGLMVGWEYGGVAMLVLGLIALSIFRKRLRGETVSTFPIVVIGVAYLAFAVWAAFTMRDPGYLVFGVTGVLLLIGA